MQLDLGSDNLHYSFHHFCHAGKVELTPPRGACWGLFIAYFVFYTDIKGLL
jgi:hypothetical protein